MNNDHCISEMNVEEISALNIEHISPEDCTICQWFKRIFTLDKISNQKNHRPVFIIIMSILQVLIFMLTYTDPSASDRSLIGILYRVGRLYLPCIRPTEQDIRQQRVTCQSFTNSDTCYYDDLVKQDCFSFLYPYQLWRLFTVAFFHSNWLHLVSNLSAQLVQGIPVERKYGTLYTLVIYWLSGLIASLVGAIRLANKAAVGASGCLHGLMLFLIMDRLSALKANGDDSRAFVIVQLLFLVSPYIITSLVLTINYHVLHDAHVGGALVGILLGIYVLGCPSICRCQDNAICHTICRRLAAIVLIIFFMATIVIFLRTDAPIVERIWESYTISNGTNANVYIE